jgi:methylated-DNA-[protein]-cysteine S-methyltransferase
MLAMTTIESPLGTLRVVADGDALAGVYLPAQLMLEEHRAARVTVDSALLARARGQLGEYLAGQRTAFTLPLLMRGTTFQQRVWQALAAIPFGATWTYAELAGAVASAGTAGAGSTLAGSAVRAARPAASRAVGGANARNPLAIVVPCHRVIGARGALTGYAGGLDAKRWLLAHERRVAGAGTPARSC